MVSDIYAQERAKLLENIDGLHVEKDKEKRVGTLILDRPPMNIIHFRNRAQISALIEAMDNDPDIRVIVIRGANGVFSSGGDIAGFLKEPRDGMSSMADDISAPERARKPVIAAIEKFALGVSFELALACDFRIATQNSQMGLPEIGLGTMPGSGGTHRLAQLVGLGRAKNTIMRGRRISALEALDWGIITELVPDGELDAAVNNLTSDLAGRPLIPLTSVKRVLNTAGDAPLHVGLELEGQAFEKIRFGPEFEHGVDSFLEKKKPDFSEM
ncbi:MAG: 2,3-dehydroadipyl-CoA hydratase [Alphaproteobacteria bacterium MarineAlpha11_Bin1]|nr:MAG: 2,3-dehydroadipyl-CoA hydratase [Alphaproteobacteria bacterium MarineAlpha11_Bin1]